MPRLMSMAKTVKQFTEGVVVRFDEWTDLLGSDDPLRDGPLALDALSWRWEWEDETKGLVRVYKDVTRRSSWDAKAKLWRPGWRTLKPGDVVEPIEWSPRVGPRWACVCGWLGSTFPPSFPIEGRRRPGQQPDSPRDEHCHGARFGHGVAFRAPRRLGLREVVSTREELLGEIDEVDVAREGFPGKSPEWFVQKYCEPGPPDPERPVNRIELREAL